MMKERHSQNTRHIRDGFTLAELLIALAILGVIATFTIPKILDSGNSSKINSIVKESAATVAEAYNIYKLNNTVDTTTTMGVITPYLNYVKQFTNAEQMNNAPSGTASACSAAAAFACYQLHNGATIWYSRNLDFDNTDSTSVLRFFIDPDSQYIAPNAKENPSVATAFVIRMNGKITSAGAVDEPHCVEGNGCYTPSGNDPDYFSWSN